ncbi:alpha/beta hydrolase [Akkermansiaceae bacterium]|nr:alpha/beta hydrolase [Akkermansiaceae bacterium]
MNKVVSYEVIGEGTPLLFMHGLGADRRQTTSALADLDGVKLIAPDFRAHGDSLYTTDDVLNFDQFADDAIAILDELGIEKANIGGLSMGSGVTLNIAFRYPERVNKIIVLRPSWPDQCEPLHLKLVADAGELIKKSGLEIAEKELEETEAYKDLLKLNEKVALSINGVYKRPQALEAASVLYKMWQDRPFASMEALKSLENQALVLYTTRDELHPVGIAEQIAESLPNSKIKELAPRYYDNATYTEQLRSVVSQFINQ